MYCKYKGNICLHTSIVPEISGQFPLSIFLFNPQNKVYWYDPVSLITWTKHTYVMRSVKRDEKTLRTYLRKSLSWPILNVTPKIRMKFDDKTFFFSFLNLKGQPSGTFTQIHTLRLFVPFSQSASLIPINYKWLVGVYVSFIRKSVLRDHPSITQRALRGKAS